MTGIRKYELAKWSDEQDVYRLTISDWDIDEEEYYVSNIIEASLRYLMNYMLQAEDPYTKLGVRKVKV